MKFYRYRSFIVVIFSFFLITGYLLIPINKAAALTDSEQQAQWQADLDATEKEIAQWQSVLDQTKQGTASLTRDANVLQAKINEAKAFIKQRQIQIQQLTSQINLKTDTLAQLEDKINRGKESMAAILRSTNELDEYSLAEVMLSNKNLSQFFEDVDSYNSIKSSLETQFNQIRDLQAQTDSERKALDDKRNQEADTKAEMEAQKVKVQQDEAEKQRLITINKTKEQTYAQVIAAQQAKAAQIRAKLFKLAGGAVAIPFGTALTYAQAVSVKTGVDPAFLLAVITHESNLGANVGKCYLSDLSSGAGVNVDTGKVWTNVMKASRDIPPFIGITKYLGIDPLKTVVSCPIGSSGYGGAMGPAQFIPSTWNLFADRLQADLGHFANPWNPEDAFMASATYLSDLGAVGTSYSAQIRAACKYYGTGGSTCAYGRNVMTLKASIQSDIDYLNDYGISRR
jgi:membrane-bound lytic murein transglycosylase B